MRRRDEKFINEGLVGTDLENRMCRKASGEEERRYLWAVLIQGRLDDVLQRPGHSARQPVLNMNTL